MERATAIELKNITKAFGTKVVANKNVSMDVKQGEILSLLGENGSGKTTLMNMLAGIYYPDSGQIFVNGQEVVIRSPIDAFNLKIGMIHQHFKLVDLFTACDNIILGEEMPKYSMHAEAKKLKEKIEEGHIVVDADNKYAPVQKIYDGDKLSTKCKYTFKVATLPFVKMGKKIKFNHLAKNRADKVQHIVDKYGFDLDIHKKIYDMSVSEKQTVEIIKVLYRGANILILDEPTAVLTPQEIKKLFDVLRNMRKDGKSIIIITHKLNEVMEISDRVAVLRKGEYIGTVNTSETSEKALTEMMVGQKIELNINRTIPQNAQDRLIVKDINANNREGIQVLSNVSFTARSGEILGIAGIAGSGQKELLEAIAGLQPKSGEIIFNRPKKGLPVSFYHKSFKQIVDMAKEGKFHYEDGSKVELSGMSPSHIKKLVDDGKILFNEDDVVNLCEKTPLQIREMGVRLSFVPEDRLGMGLVGSMDLVDNMMLRSYRKGKTMFLNRKKPEKLAEEIVEELEVKTPNLHTQVRKLSGGNVQKILVGREIAATPKVLMAAYPVRGLDINSSYTIYNLLNSQKEKGVAVIFVGEDLDVLLALCDRILVLCGGKISGIVDARNTTKEDIGLLMTSIPENIEIFSGDNYQKEENANE